MYRRIRIKTLRVRDCSSFPENKSASFSFISTIHKIIIRSGSHIEEKPFFRVGGGFVVGRDMGCT
jgi:hypothetical protein